MHWGRHVDRWISKCGTIELRQGDWREALADVERCDAVITDPPYGARTHNGQRHRRHDGAETIATLKIPHGLGYQMMTQAGVAALVERFAPVTSLWGVYLTSHDLWPAFESAARSSNWYCFAPIACVQVGLNVRLAGDGPCNWTCWAAVMRPHGNAKWGALPGAYCGTPFDKGENTTNTHKRDVPGGKPLWLMRALIRDYSRPGDLVVDPFAGGATTLIACAIEGRRCIGAELDPETYRKAVRRLSAGWTVDFTARMPKPKQGVLV